MSLLSSILAAFSRFSFDLSPFWSYSENEPLRRRNVLDRCRDRCD